MNVRICRIGFVTLAVRPIAGHGAEGVIGGNPGQDNPEAVGVLDPHLDQSPGLRRGLPDDPDAGRS